MALIKEQGRMGEATRESADYVAYAIAFEEIAAGDGLEKRASLCS